MDNKFIQKYNRIPVTLKATIWFTICNIILKGISFFTTPLFTRLLPTEEYGLLTILLSYENLILIFSTWELSIGTYQKGLFKYKNETKKITASLLIFSNLLTIIIFLLIIFFWKWFSSFTGFTRLPIFILFFYLIVQPAYSCWTIRKRIIYDYKSIVIVTILFTVLSIFVPIIAILKLGATAEYKFIFSLIPLIICYAMFYFKSFKIKQILLDKHFIAESWHFFLKMSPPLVIHSLSFLILGQADRVMIGKMVNNSTAAIYSIAYTIASITSLLQSSVTTVLVPWTYQNLEKENYDLIRNKTKILVILIGSIYLLFVLILPEVLKYLFPYQYYDAIWSIPPITIGSFFMFFYSLFVNVETYLEKTKYIAIVSVLCATLNILLNYFGIKYFGYIACAYTTLICYIMFAIGHGYFMSKMCSQLLNGKRMYNLHFFCLIGFFMLVFMLFFTFLYPFPVLRYSLIVFILLISLPFRKRIICFIKGFNNK